ncbi:TRAP transporter substrate-binding protein DctP [Uliginosibacterium sp. sgz301328]|uniref:TRAP transporter substrate-binding protein DctP n=1 Tax=Uliginosibacterium sp. sgz301328 TaxID=3243764 RepID=UPI00359D702F
MLRRLLLGCVMGLALPALAHADPLKGWVQGSEEFPSHQGLKLFMDEVKAKTGGKFEGQIQTKDTLGDIYKALPLVDKGQLDVAVISNTPMYKAVPEMEVLSLPFMFSDTRGMMKALDGELGKGLEKKLATKSFIVLGWYDGGSRSFYLKTKPTGYATDIEGKTLRVADREALRTMVTSLGGSAVMMPLNQMPKAFTSNELDGAETDIFTYAKEEHFKYAPYFLVSNHSMQPEALIVSTQLWAKLSEAEKKVFLEAGHNSAVAMRELWARQSATLRAKLEKQGVKFLDLKNQTSFISRMRQVYQPILNKPDASELMLRIMTTRG